MIEVDASCGILNKELVYVLENNTSSKTNIPEKDTKNDSPTVVVVENVSQ